MLNATRNAKDSLFNLSLIIRANAERSSESIDQVPMIILENTTSSSAAQVPANEEWSSMEQQLVNIIFMLHSPPFNKKISQRGCCITAAQGSGENLPNMSRKMSGNKDVVNGVENRSGETRTIRLYSSELCDLFISWKFSPQCSPKKEGDFKRFLDAMGNFLRKHDVFGYTSALDKSGLVFSAQHSGILGDHIGDLIFAFASPLGYVLTTKLKLKRAPWKLQTHLDNIKGIMAQLEQVPRYGIRSFEFVFQRGMPLELKKSSETEKTVEEINYILRQQPMVGATTVYKSLKDFKGEATSSTGSTSMTSIVQCQVGDKKAICICSLLPEKQERCLLNLEFEEDHADTFLVIGSHSVHLSGFFYGESEDCFGDEYASDPYEEGAAEIDSESSDSIKFEDVAEDGDKDGSTDDAFKILEEEEPRDESGTLKRPKKKKHHLNVTDEEENLIVIKGNTDSPLSESEDEDGFSLCESKSKSATSKKSDGIEDEDTHEEALNEKARGTDVDERKGLQRIVCEDTRKTYDYQSRGEQIRQKKVMDGEELAGAHPEHVEANNEPIDDDFSMYLPSPVPNSGVFISLLIQLEIGSYVEQVTGFKKALLDPRLLEAERLKKKSSPSTDEEKKEMFLVPYSYAVGSLMYSMVCTRPDIARYC
ncbi:Peptidyl-prolyl cis-trans isomerase FKBP53 [Capsicum baccatum]|uniref:peptidylprolyl isomerase n=1 Tax=Capsicum baccatum TaxID=33114 RepID=A0A2G2WTT3_CAPBA|nr:Peptidyl-prolyl cis-trans isomerase FKBP53 [Capsicum baccatum]